MAQYLGAKVGEWVPGNWDTLPESVRVNKFGIGNMVKGTPWTLAELEQVQGMTEAEQIAAGYLSRNPGQLAALLAEAKATEGYYVDPQTKGVVLSKSNVPTAGQVSTSGAPLTPGLIGGVDKPFRQYWGPSSSATWGMDASGNIVQTNAPTTGQESLEETIKIASAGSRGVNALGQAGSVLTRGVSFAYDNAGNIVSATGPDGKPISVEEGKKRWENFFIDNPDQATPSTGVGTGIRRPERQGIRYEDGVAIPGTGMGTSTSAVTGTSTGTTTNPFIPGSEAAKAWDERKSAYDLLYSQFKQYGLDALITPLKSLITEGVPASEFTIRLRETDAYKKRFAANADRIKNGLAAISEAQYLALEDQYQNVMRNYGLPESYYTRGDMGTQEGFNKFIGNDVSATELEDRIMTAQSRVINSNPEVLDSLKKFYPGITNGDILAYALNPKEGLTEIKRKVTAAEIGGAATQAGLGITGARAAELGAAGISKQQAQQGFQTVAEVAPRGGQLAEMYKQTPYTQQTAEQEVFGLAGSVEAAKQRKKLTGLEKATFSAQTGAAQGALGRERAGNF